MKEDSIEGIYDTLKTCANISKSAGGIGLAVHCIRAYGSYIAGVRECVPIVCVSECVCVRACMYCGELRSTTLVSYVTIIY